jgi:peroxiredoxin
MREAARQNLRNAVVIAVTTVVILGGLLLVKQPWKSGSDGSGGSSGGVTQVDVQLAPGQAAPAVGQPAPDFTAITVSGESITLSALRGEPVWLLFGATWCADCRVEAPDVQALSSAYAGRVRVVAVYVDETSATVSDYASRVGLTYPQIADASDAIASHYGVMGIPAHYFLDASGVIQKISVGTLTQASARTELESLLAG